MIYAVFPRPSTVPPPIRVTRIYSWLHNLITLPPTLFPWAGKDKNFGLNFPPFKSNFGKQHFSVRQFQKLGMFLLKKYKRRRQNLLAEGRSYSARKYKWKVSRSVHCVTLALKDIGTSFLVFNFFYFLFILCLRLGMKTAPFRSWSQIV